MQGNLKVLSSLDAFEFYFKLVDNAVHHHYQLKLQEIVLTELLSVVPLQLKATHKPQI